MMKFKQLNKYNKFQIINKITIVTKFKVKNSNPLKEFLKMILVMLIYLVKNMKNSYKMMKMFMILNYLIQHAIAYI